MIKFILTAIKNMEKLEKQREKDLAEKQKKEERKMRILDSGKDLE